MAAKGRHQNRSSSLAKPLKLYCILVTTLSIITLIYFFWKNPQEDKTAESLKQTGEYSDTHMDIEQPVVENKGPGFEGDKIVHLDLKGAPPKISYFSKLFPLIKKLGATGILIEYEDMFPYSNELANISALNAYSTEDIITINNLAKENDLKIIPLVQTFGHMEFILKLKDFKDYREVHAYPQVICPTHENTKHLIKIILKQIVQAHPDAQMIHIGADEVYYIGQCNRCTDFMLKYSYTKNQLFLEHINNVVSVINELFPHLKILMWDDQFRSLSQSELKKVSLSNSIEPVVWKYTKEVYEDLGPSLWDNYSKKFRNVWAASAFKGAVGKTNLNYQIFLA